CRLPPPPSASRLDRQKRRRGAAYVFPMPLALDQPLLPVSCRCHVPWRHQVASRCNCAGGSPFAAKVAHSPTANDTATGKEIRRFPGGGCMVFSPDGKLLATGGPFCLWRVDTGEKVWAAQQPSPVGADAVAFSPDGSLVAAVEKHSTVAVYKTA